MTQEEYKTFLGASKYDQLQRIANNDEAMEALEAVICQEIKNDNIEEPNKHADTKGNFFYAYIDRLGPSLSNAELGEKLRSYHFALLALQRAFSTLSKFEKQTEKVEEEQNPGI